MAQPTGTFKNREETKPGTTGQMGTDLKNKAQEAGSAATEKAANLTEKAREGAAGLMDKAREGVSTVTEKARDAASSVASTASDVASNVGQRAEDATSAVGGSMKSLASTIRENAPQSGFVGSASSAVASTLEGGGQYLQEQGLGGVADDVTNLIRRNPIPALLVGIGIGFLIARATTRR
jgi:hypothetical protein